MDSLDSPLRRRSFLKTAGIAAAGLALGGARGTCAWADGSAPDASPHAEKLGWRLGSQAYTFRNLSFFDAVDQIAAIGLGYVEAYPGQTLSKEKPGVRMDVGLGAADRQAIKTRLAATGVRMVGFGVCPLNANEAEARKTFDFAKDMGVTTVVSEPPEDAFDLLDKLCNEYQINLAIHNHPKPSHYWDYRTVLKVCKDRSKRIGACCDTGHWMRSGIRPLEALKALEGRIVSFHLKDLNEFGKPGAHDVPWGTGKANMREILAEIHRQKFQGVFVAEYEHMSPELSANLAKCAEYFDTVAGELAATK
jgi:sugar phosphate isomerase/epimerase